ncbi:MAG: glycosyltransferase [Saprospiraceae bacterium]|nr:glycosyltransferase [Saprospiraceae bacterium]
MASTRVHIVSFDVPYPPDYGGIMDIYYRCKTLTRLGVEVVLHCYQYGRPVRKELEEVAAEIYYYPRKRAAGLFSLTTPHIVASRNAPALLDRLLLDDAPVLFEGLHTTAFLDHPSLSKRIRVVRMHNIEQDYYRQLGQQERNPLRKLYCYVEAWRLNRYEPILKHADYIATVSAADTAELTSRYGQKVQEVASFHPYDQVEGAPGKGAYAFYHANLSVMENHRAALWLIQSVFATLEYPLVIAGLDPSPQLLRAAKPWPWIRILDSPSEVEMDALLRDAQVVVIPTFQSTGLKLKLLNSLFKGRHIVTTEEMVSGTVLGGLCTIENDPLLFQKRVAGLAATPFTEKMRAVRRQVLVPQFDNLSNGKKLMGLLGV